MNGREPVRARAHKALGNFRTNSDPKTALFCAVRANPQLSISAVNTLITAAFRTNRAMPRDARNGFESR